MNETWPYITDSRGSESMGHVYLKNVAIHWLRRQGATLQDIELEHRVESTTDGYGLADVYGVVDGECVYVECETEFSERQGDLSRGGRIPAQRGSRVYLVTDQAIYRVAYEAVDSTRQETNRPLWAIPIEEESRHKQFQYYRVGSPPLLPV